MKDLKKKFFTVSLYGTISKQTSFHSNFIFSKAFSRECSLAAVAPISSNLWKKKENNHYLEMIFKTGLTVRENLNTIRHCQLAIKKFIRHLQQGIEKQYQTTPKMD